MSFRVIIKMEFHTKAIFCKKYMLTINIIVDLKSLHERLNRVQLRDSIKNQKPHNTVLVSAIVVEEPKFSINRR